MREKKRNKKILSLLIATLMIISMLPSSVFAAADDVMIEEYADMVTEEADVVDDVAEETAEVPDAVEQEVDEQKVEADLAGASEVVSATAEGILSGGKMTFDAVLDGVSVYAAVPASRAPRGSVMTADLVDVSDFADAISAKIYGKDVSALKGLELHFYNKKGKEITHINTSDVTITADAMDADSYALCRLNGRSVGVVKKVSAPEFTFKEKKAYTYAIAGLISDGVLRATAETGSNGEKSFSLDNIEVIAPKDAFADDVAMEASDVTSDKSAKDDELVGSSGDEVIAAYEISFYNEEGVEQQPEKEVKVKITTALDMSKNYKLIHTADNGETNEVENAVFSENGVEFVADSFSTYTVVWTDAGGIEQSATIHWGTYNGGVFEDLESPTTLDTTASSVKLDVIIDDYYFVGAEYKATESSDGVNLTSTTLKKATDGTWQVTLEESGTVTIADGSHIYVNYAPMGSGGYTPPTPPPPEVLAPVTTKNVEDNKDGTYTITLNIEGKEDQEITQVGANVIIVMDITQSMTNSMPNSTRNRMQAAKAALTTLIDTLKPSENLINFTAVNFGETSSYSNGVNWTQDEQAMRTYVTGLPDSPDQYGTCW